MTDMTTILARLLPDAGGESPITHRSGVVVSLGTDGTVNVALSGVTVAAKILSGVAVAAGDQVELAVWQGDLLILGRAASAVAHDASTESATFTTTTPHTFTHTPVGAPRGVLVFVAHGTPQTDIITSVSYGGVAMTRVAIAQDAAGEAGASYAYFLGSGIPAGAQTVSIVHTGSATVKWAVCSTLSAPANTSASQAGTLAADQANPQIALTTGAVGARYAVIYSGADAVGDLTPLAGMTAIADNDFGSFVSRVDRQTVAASGAFVIGYTAASDDVAMIGLAVTCPAGPPYVEYRLAGSQTIATGSLTTVDWDPNPLISSGAWSETAGVITVPLSGYYSLDSILDWAANTTGTRAEVITRNGSVNRIAYFGTLASTQTVMALARPSIYLDAGDTIQQRVYQNSGGNLAVAEYNAGAGDKSPGLTIRYLGPR